jgi:hypothetical protein
LSHSCWHRGDCHHPDSDFFFASDVKYLFDENARPVTEPQYRLLGLSLPAARIGAWREAYLKPVTYGMIVFLCLGVVALAGGVALRWVFEPRPVPASMRRLPPVIAMLAGVAAMMLLWRPQLMEYMLPTRFWLDGNHFLIAVAILIGGLVAFLGELKIRVSGIPSRRSWFGSLAGGELLISLVLASVTGVLIFLKMPGLDQVTRYAYSIFDLAVTLVILGTIVVVLRHAARMAAYSSATVTPGEQATSRTS